MATRPIATAGLALAIVVTLGACSAARENGLKGRSDGVATTVAPPAYGALSEARLAQAAPEAPAVADRSVVTKASVELQATDTRSVMQRVTELTKAAGGYVSNATVNPVTADGEQPVVSMTLRIPATALDATLSSIEQMADDVVSTRLASQDVTDQVVDIDARLRNLRALEEELRALLADVRRQPGADPDKLLRVFEQIGSTRGQIEQLEGSKQLLENQVALATVDLSISPFPPAARIVTAVWRPVEVAKEALRSMVLSLRGVANGAIWAILYALPLLIMAALPVLGVFVWWRRRGRRSTVSPDAPADGTA